MDAKYIEWIRVPSLLRDLQSADTSLQASPVSLHGIGFCRMRGGEESPKWRIPPLTYSVSEREERMPMSSYKYILNLCAKVVVFGGICKVHFGSF